MLLTPSQTDRFWCEWNKITRTHAWDKPESERQRKSLLNRSGFTSLTLVDKLDGFDRVLVELAAITRPDDLEAQMREATMLRTRLLFAIGNLRTPLSPSRAHLSYACAIARDKFGTADIESLHDGQLLDLRNTLAARLCAHRRNNRRNPASGHQMAA